MAIVFGSPEAKLLLEQDRALIELRDDLDRARAIVSECDYCKGFAVCPYCEGDGEIRHECDCDFCDTTMIECTYCTMDDVPGDVGDCPECATELKGRGLLECLNVIRIEQSD